MATLKKSNGVGTGIRGSQLFSEEGTGKGGEGMTGEGAE